MNGFPDMRSFLARYFPVFMGAIFAAVFSLVFAVPLIFDSYFPRLPMDFNLKYSFLGGLALTWGIVQCNFMIARGRPQWVWPLVALFALCVLAVLPTIAFGPHPLSYGLTLPMVPPAPKWTSPICMPGAKCIYPAPAGSAWTPPPGCSPVKGIFRWPVVPIHPRRH